MQDAPVDELFGAIEEKIGIKPEYARLVYNGKTVLHGSGKKICEIPGIKNESVLFLVHRLQGGRKELDPTAPRTKELDMITWDEDNVKFGQNMAHGNPYNTPCE